MLTAASVLTTSFRINRCAQSMLDGRFTLYLHDPQRGVWTLHESESEWKSRSTFCFGVGVQAGVGLSCGWVHAVSNGAERKFSL